MILPGLYSQLTSGTSSASVQKILGQPAGGSVFIVAATKLPRTPYLVMNRVGGLPAGQTLDGTSDLIDGELQFDSYADTPQAAEKLSNTVRDYLMRTFSAGQLPDGTNVQFVEVTADHDEGYEQGGTGYVYRALLRLHAFYTEAP